MAVQHAYTATIYVINKALRIRGENEKPEEVLISGMHYKRPVMIDHAGAWVSGMTLDGGSTDRGGANVLIGSRGGTVSNCVIRGGNISNYGQGAAAYLGGKDALLTHCVVTNNWASTSDGENNRAILYMVGGRIENCLVAGNFINASDPVANGGSVVNMLAGGSLRNNTIANNMGVARGVVAAAAGTVVEHCVIAGNTLGATGGPAFIGAGSYANNTVDDPTRAGLCRVSEPHVIFQNFDKADYQLGPDSPAVNTGPRASEGDIKNAGIDLIGNPRIRCLRLDDGCYESRFGGGGTLLMVR